MTWLTSTAARSGNPARRTSMKFTSARTRPATINVKIRITAI